MGKREIPIETMFLIFALIFGLLFVFIIPPFQGNDEPNHFSRGYQIAQGRIISNKTNSEVGDSLPASINRLYELSRYDYIRKNRYASQTIEDIKTLAGISLNRNEKIHTVFANTSVYPPLAYTGIALGIKLSDIFSTPPLYSFYLGRVFGLLFWLIIVFYAIRFTPIYKLLFLFIALLPTTLYQVSTISSDPIIIATGLFLTALILKYNQENVKIDTIFIVLFSLCVISLFLNKLVYVPAALLIFVIPLNNFKSRKSQLLILTTAVFIGFMFFLIWYFLNTDLVIHHKPGVNISKQFWFILSHPLYYIWVIISTISWNLFSIIKEFISFLGWNYEPALPSRIYYFIYIIILLIVARYDISENFILLRKQKYILLSAFISSILLLCTILYLTWTPVGRYHILGLYGRYFTPISMLLFLVLYRARLWNKIPEIPVKRFLENKTVMLALSASLLYTSIVIFARYWL